MATRQRSTSSGHAAGSPHAERYFLRRWWTIRLPGLNCSRPRKSRRQNASASSRSSGTCPLGEFYKQGGTPQSTDRDRPFHRAEPRRYSAGGCGGDPAVHCRERPASVRPVLRWRVDPAGGTAARPRGARQAAACAGESVSGARLIQDNGTLPAERPQPKPTPISSRPPISSCKEWISQNTAGSTTSSSGTAPMRRTSMPSSGASSRSANSSRTCGKKTAIRSRSRSGCLSRSGCSTIIQSLQPRRLSRRRTGKHRNWTQGRPSRSGSILRRSSIITGTGAGSRSSTATISAARSRGRSTGVPDAGQRDPEYYRQDADEAPRVLAIEGALLCLRLRSPVISALRRQPG